MKTSFKSDYCCLYDVSVDGFVTDMEGHSCDLRNQMVKGSGAIHIL